MDLVDEYEKECVIDMGENVSPEWRAVRENFAAWLDRKDSLRARLAAAEAVVDWARRYIHADTNEKDREAFDGLARAVFIYSAALLRQGAAAGEGG